MQFVFSVISGFFFGFLGIELLIGSLDFGFRLLLGIICALVIALAEIYFLAKKLIEEEDALENQKVQPEPPLKSSEKLKTN
jgi:TMEM199 family protein